MIVPMSHALRLAVASFAALALTHGAWAESKKPTTRPKEDPKKTEKKADDSKYAATITIKNISFNPETVTIKKGQTVRWVNNDNRDHSIMAKDQSFKSGDLKNGETFEFTFKEAGTFDYICVLRPRMLATIVVEE